MLLRMRAKRKDLIQFSGSSSTKHVSLGVGSTEGQDRIFKHIQVGLWVKPQAVHTFYILGASLKGIPTEKASTEKKEAQASVDVGSQRLLESPNQQPKLGEIGQTMNLCLA